jgi:O-antigen biosynthesis protein
MRHYLRKAKKSAAAWYAGAMVKVLNGLPIKPRPVFSVVIPIYDRTAVVREAIESILKQSFQNFELLLVCDGSPPETLAVIEDFRADDKVRVFFFSESSGNACRARNHGILQARGHYVTFLDSDDIATPIRLERTLFHFFYHKVDIVGGMYECLVETGSGREVANGQIGYAGESCLYEGLLEQNLLGMCTISVKRSALLEFGGFRKEMRYREDHELWLRLVYRGCRIYNAPELFAKYRVHSGNAELSYLENDRHWHDEALRLHREPFYFVSSR